MNRRFKRVVLVIAALGVGLVPFACGGDDAGTDPDPDPDPTEEGETVTVTLTSDRTFDPENVVISPGDRIEWVDESDGGDAHTVTPDGHDEWDTRDMTDGDVFTHQFDATGTFDYYCIPHRGDGMTGRVTVRE